MISTFLNYSQGYKRYFDNAPRLYEKMKIQASKRVLEMWQSRAFERAPYDRGHLRREIKPLYNRGMLVAGQFLSKDYAHIQDVGGQAGRNYSVTIKPNHYFYKMAEDSESEVEKIYDEEVEKVLNG